MVPIIIATYVLHKPKAMILRLYYSCIKWLCWISLVYKFKDMTATFKDMFIDLSFLRPVIMISHKGSGKSREIDMLLFNTLKMAKFNTCLLVVLMIMPWMFFALSYNLQDLRTGVQCCMGIILLLEKFGNQSSKLQYSSACSQFHIYVYI